MKKRYLAIPLLLCLTHPAWADDTDIYGVAGTNDITPNVLLVFDNSGSMSTEDVPGTPYAPTTTYTGSKSAKTVYIRTGSWWLGYDYDDQFWPDIDSVNWQCEPARTSLRDLGYWQGRIKISSGRVLCSTNWWDDERLRTGNYENYNALGLGVMESRMVVAKKVVANLIFENNANVNFGLMQFNTPADGGYIMAEVGASTDTLIKNYDPDTSIFLDDDQSDDFGILGSLESGGYTPLAETLAEAGLYYAAETSWFDGTARSATSYPVGKYDSNCTSYGANCGNYTNDTPVQYRCQQNYIILMTDGDPTSDGKNFSRDYIGNSALSNSGDTSSYLDDVSYYLAHNDILPVGASPSDAEILQRGTGGDYEDQNVTTYTIGFKNEQALLDSTALRGGGSYHTAENASSLGEALNSIITDISVRNEGFSAAAVPVSRANKVYAGNFVYYGLFQPVSSGQWIGNLKKYGLTNDGVIQDADGNAIAAGATIIDNARSYWSESIDGATVASGGAGEKLLNDIKGGFSRNIYTYTGTATALSDSTNLFTTSNISLNSNDSPSVPAYNGLTDSVITAVRHEDEEWPLGSLLHSQPLVVHYNIDDADQTNDKSMLFAGANDGMLHCFDDADGSEKWAYIPSDLLGNLSNLVTENSLQYFVDGTPVFYQDGSKKLVIFGERRGGNHYSALDITDYDRPLFVYSIDDTILRDTDVDGNSVGEYLGQSWANPQKSQMATAEGGIHTDGSFLPTPTKDVFVLAGGYDTNQDTYDPDDASVVPAATDSQGRAFYAVDSATGALFSNFNFNAYKYPSLMTHSILAVNAFENPKTRTTTRAYVGDLNGNLFAVRDDINHRNQLRSEASTYGGNYDGREDGVWEQMLRLISTPGKKIFYAPNSVKINYWVDFTYPAAEIEDATEDVVKTEKRTGEFIYYGTGDRSHPERTDITNGFYAIKNNWQWINPATGNPTSTPDIARAYVDEDDYGKIKKIDGDADPTNDVTLVGIQRDANGQFIHGVNAKGTIDEASPYILDVTRHLFQNDDADQTTRVLLTKYVKDAIDHSSNKGWYFDLLDENDAQWGEKVVSSPIIYRGIVYFTTYVPAPDDAVVADDPCATPGATGKGYLYAVGYKYGEAINTGLDNSDETDDAGLAHEDRRRMLKTPGIPPQPVIVIHEGGKPSIITGFESIDPESLDGVEQFYWRQLNR